MEQRIKEEIDKKQKVNNIFFYILWFIIGIVGCVHNLDILWLLLPLTIYFIFTQAILADLWCKVGTIFFIERFKEFEISYDIEKRKEKE